MNRIKVTIITVIFNAANKLERTMLSVLNQSYKNIEYVIVDGCSEDGSLDIIQNIDLKIREGAFDINPENFKWKSESDNGIYDAMNKAVKISTGEWIIFMNAGDGFFDSQVIEDVIKNLENTDADIIYGNDWIELRDSRRIHHKADNPIKDLWKAPFLGMELCLQNHLC
ncbi:MAG: glycosyltransferase [Paludibacteraceae bacterium]